MDTLIIACRTIADELTMAVKETGCSYPILWIDSGLHIQPDSLRKRLQQELDHLSNIDTALLAFGYCGNSVIGLRPPSFQLIIPRADDCITLLLGSRERRRQISENECTYYLTKGWLDFEKNIWVEYQQCVTRYGKEKADRVFEMMLAHYTSLGIIETGAFDLEEFFERTEVIAEALRLSRRVIPGTLRYIKKLLTGPWDDEFITIGPGEAVSEAHIFGQRLMQPVSSNAVSAGERPQAEKFF
ncbi:MAG: DUF1638 domain-containing protein [Clostridia bacterium]|nr:DUF1638 domain-containing protein [Clostridia bacterium]